MAKIAMSALVSNIRGSVSSNVFSRAHNGATVRTRVKPLNPRSTAQSAIRAYLAAASRAFKALNATQLAAWKAYAASLVFHNPVSGTAYSPSGITAFNQLATKYLQCTPGGTIPTTPPAAPFTGDTITLTAAGASGKVTFTPSGSNGAGIKTELLVQKLKSANRAAAPRGYRTQQFSTTVTTTPIDVTLTPGVYVPAYRFVKTATGQASGLVVLAAVTVS